MYLRRGTYYVDSESLTVSGLWISTGDVRIVERGDADALAGALRAMMELSKEHVPNPQPGKRLAERLLAAAKLKTWKSFARETVCVGATHDNGWITLTPNRAVDVVGNYVPLSQKSRSVRYASEELGQTILEAFSDAAETVAK
jgi:hypothetical protein